MVIDTADRTRSVVAALKVRSLVCLVPASLTQLHRRHTRTRSRHTRSTGSRTSDKQA